MTVSVDNRFNDTDNKINTKIDSNELKVLDEKLSKAIKDAIESLMSKFADKKDTRKAFKYIEALVRSANQTETTEKREGEDAMFARKPLGGWSCASCEKGLESLTGKIAYHPWNKLPYRDPVDRIARAGPGFSRMLSTLPSESIKTSRLETIRSTTPISQMSEYEPAYTEPIILPKFRADRSVTPNPR